MNAAELFDTADCFALQSQSGFLPPSIAARAADLAAEVATMPPPEPPAPKAPFRLSPAELVKIDRNMRRLAEFSDPSASMF